MILVIFGVLLVVVLALVIVKVSSVIVGERQLLMSLCKFLVGGGEEADTIVVCMQLHFSLYSSTWTQIENLN